MPLLIAAWFIGVSTRHAIRCQSAPWQPARRWSAAALQCFTHDSLIVCFSTLISLKFLTAVLRLIKVILNHVKEHRRTFQPTRD